MPIESSEFRRVMGHLVTGVTVVTSRDPATGAACGLTANAVASVSLKPPLVLVCVEHTADSHDCIRDAGLFAMNFLAADQEKLSRRFSAWDMADKFVGVSYRTEATGAPILDGVLGWVDCRLRAEHPGGDHTIFLGEVLAGDAREGRPLLYYRGGYGRYVP